jgi:hypothetical protein
MKQANGANLSASQLGELLDRIARSPQFSKSSRLQSLLVYLCRHAADGKTVHEQQIGHEVFHREPDYLTSEDNIVRVTVSQLRRRLSEYFSTVGKDEPIVITLPQGSYTPVFLPRKAFQSRPSSWIRSKAVLAILAGVLLLAVALALVFPRSERSIAIVQTREATVRSTNVNRLWQGLFSEREPTLLVTADSCLAVLQDALRTSIPLSAYANHSFLDKLKTEAPAHARWIDLIGGRQYTSFGDLFLTARIQEVASHLGGSIVIRYARDVTIRDLRSWNKILLGSRRSNPWVELFETTMNFRIMQDEATQTPYVQNVSPRPGELQTYGLTKSTHPGTKEAYGVLAFLPNLSRDGHVLIVEGVSMEGTEAGGEGITSEPFAAKLMQALGAQNKLPYFEVLVRFIVVGGAAGRGEIVAHRIISDSQSIPAPDF